MASLRLVGAVGPDGARLDLDCAGALVSAVYPGGLAAYGRAGGGPAGGGPAAGRPAVGPALRTVDVAGMVLLPAMAEPHAHVDKAYTADYAPNPTGDLVGAIAASCEYFAAATVDDIAARAGRALRAYIAKGCLSVRTHVAVGPVTGLKTVQGVLQAAAEMGGLIDVQVVAHIAYPVVGAAGRDNLALLRDALALGATHVGGTPYMADDPVAETRACLEEAGRAGLGVDLHTDETLNPASLTVLDLAEAVQRTGFPYPVAASHCVSLGVQEPAVQQRVAEALAAAGIAVITLPQTNLFLQARGLTSAPPRGLTALAALQQAGALVAAGGDNVQDPFNPMGKGDPLEAASLLVTAGHMAPGAAFEAVSSKARAVCGFAPGALEPGSAADLVAVPGTNLRESMAEGAGGRVVVRQGVVIYLGGVAQRAGAEVALV